MRILSPSLLALGLILCLASCQALPVPESNSDAAPAGSAVSGAVPAEGPAATVNGTPIAMDGFRRQALDTQRFYVERGLDPNTDAGQQELQRLRGQVLDDMINQLLIEAAATEMGITASDTETDENLKKSIEALGGEAKFKEALEKSGSTLDDVRAMERASIIGRKVLEQVTAELPTTAAAVHARHILCEQEAACQAAMTQLEGGADFATVAKAVSKDTATGERGGDLDWVVRGMLPSQQVEDAIFAVTAGERSAVVKTDFGYHIIEALEVEPNHILSEDQLNQLRQRKLQDWLKTRRAQAAVVILVDDLKDAAPKN
jgi:parvulin-like peptidyl-prolyl isomerase